MPVATEDERSSPSLGPSVPPSSASEGGFDDFDIDAMIREDEESRAQASTSTSRAPNAPVPGLSSNLDDEEAMWDAVMGDFPDEPFVPQDRPPAAQIKVLPPPVDEDEEMWDMVREMEMEAERASSGAKAPTSVAAPATSGEASQAGANGLVGQDPTRKATNDEGWDEMYA